MADSGTYDQATVTRRQKIAEQMLAESSRPRVIRNPVEGLGYLANVGADAFALNRLDKQAGEARKADTAALMSILGGGGAQPAPSAVASPSPAPSLPPPSPTVMDAGGPAKPDAQGVYDSDAVMMPPASQPDFGKAIAGIESGGKYDAMGPVTKSGDQAYGKYQVMGANIPEWTKAHIGREMSPGEFLASPEAQDAVFKGQFGKYASAYGPEGAARAWFAGEGGMNDPGRTDQLGTSVKSYGDQFTKNMGGPGAVAQAMSPSAALPPANAPAPAPPPAAAPGALPNNQPIGIPDQQKAAIARLMSATPGSPAYQLGLQLAGQSLAPKNFTHQTLPNGDILQVDPTGKLPPKVIYQAPVKSELKDTGTDPLTGQKSFSEYNPQAHTLTPMSGGTTAVPSDQTFNAIAAAKERGASQQELYQHVPISLRNGVQAMIEGKSLPANLSNRGAARDATLKYAHAIDENFDEMLIPQRKAFATSMGSQQISSFGGQVRSAGTIVKHLGGAGEAFKTLEDSGAINETLPLLNRPQLAMKGQSGDKKFNDAMGRWSVDVEGIAGELSQLLTGGVGAERTKQEWRDKLDIRTQPISKVKASLDEAAQLMLGRLSNVAQAKERAYQSPTDPVSLLGPGEQKIMQRLKAGTYQPDAETKVPGTPQTATNPQTGERVQLNPKTGQWEPLK